MNALAQIETSFEAVFDIQKLDGEAWYFASSKDLPNMIVDGPSIDDICSHIPLIAKRLFETNNKAIEVVQVEKTTLSSQSELVASLHMDYRVLADG